MKILSTSLVLMLGSALLLPALTAPQLSREEALRKLEACVNSKTGEECNDIKVAAETLARLYRQGDKSVLPALMEAPSMGEFLADALLDDTAGYLSALSTLPAPRQPGVESKMAGGLFSLSRERYEALWSALVTINSSAAPSQGDEAILAGGGFGLPRERFEALQSALLKISSDSPVYPLAQSSLRQLRIANARLLTAYFPPKAFTSRAGGFLTNWYSSELYALGEAPLWPPAANQHVYRFTVLPSMSLNVSVTLTVSANGGGVIRERTGVQVLGVPGRERTLTLTPHQVNDLLTLIGQADFWRMPAEIDRRGPWWAECIMEGVRDGQYHVVTRQSAEVYNDSAYRDLLSAVMKVSEQAK